MEVIRKVWAGRVFLAVWAAFLVLGAGVAAFDRDASVLAAAVISLPLFLGYAWADGHSQAARG